MADEDELFAQFMGEINSTVVEFVDDGGEISDAASVGGVEEGDTIADDTAKRKAGTEASPLPAAKKPKVTAKLVAAALPMKAGAASAAVPKTPASRTDARKSGANSASPAGDPAIVKAMNGAGAGSGTSGATESRKDGVSPPPRKMGKTHGVTLGASSAGDNFDAGDFRRDDARTGRVRDGNGGDGAGGNMRSAVNGAHNVGRSGASISEVGLQGQPPGVARGAIGLHHPHMTAAGMPGNGGMGMDPRGGELGMGMNMGMMAGNGGGGFGVGYGMAPGMGMNMGMEMAMGMPPGMGPGPYSGSSMGYGFDGRMTGFVPISGGGTEDGMAGTAEAMGGMVEEGKRGKGKRKEGKASEDGAKKFKRVAGGKSWEDETLADWPENDYRLFVGDLGNEVTDEHLAGAFRKYASFAKARVIREKWNKKSKGYGFISFLDGMDMLKALREQNGKYLGNRPMKISRSNWKERDVKEVRKRNKKAKKVKKQLGML